jgi:hypothetical protein
LFGETPEERNKKNEEKIEKAKRKLFKNVEKGHLEKKIQKSAISILSSQEIDW